MKWSHVALLLCAFAVFRTPTPAHAHLRLASSVPAQGDTVRQPLSEIRLKFTEAVDERYTVITLLDAFGNELGMTMVHAVGPSPSKEYMLMLTRPLMTGAFTVKWKTVGTDGHVVTGMFDFVVAAVAPGAAAPQAPIVLPPAEAHEHEEAAEVPPMYQPESSLFWIAARWFNFTALLLIVGCVAFRFAVLERARKRLSGELVDDVDASVRRLAIFAAVGAIVSNAMRLWLQSGSINGPEHMFEPHMLTQLVLTTGWGKAWLAQTVASVGFLTAVAIRSRDRLDSWFSAGAFALIAASTPSFSGHAIAVEQMAIVPVLDDVAHVIAASSWLGTLGVLLIAALPVSLRHDNGFATVSTLVNTFSPFALLMGGLTAFTGAMNALMHLTSFSDFWTTSYGRVLTLKIGIVIIAMTIGAYNWQVVKPRLGSEPVTSHLRRSAGSEFTVAVIIILITAVLVGTPTH